MNDSVKMALFYGLNVGKNVFKDDLEGLDLDNEYERIQSGRSCLPRRLRKKVLQIKEKR